MHDDLVAVGGRAPVEISLQRALGEEAERIGAPLGSRDLLGH